MKILYYDIIFRECGYLYNEGFLVVEVKDNRIENIEAVLTCDYIKSEIFDDYIQLDYYGLDDSYKKLSKNYQIIIPREYFEVPINIQVENNGFVIEILTKRKVSNPNIIKQYNQELKKFKKSNVF